MKRILPLALCTLGLILLLCSCDIYQRSYTSISTHVDQRVTDEDPSVLRAETYQELVSSILHFVTEGQEVGVVRLYQYTGDVESDLDAACQEILTQDPVGAYALSDLQSSYSRIVSYYECTFTFTYSHTLEQINSVSTIASMVYFRKSLQQTMDSFGQTLTVRTGLDLTQESILALIQDYYYSNPLLALGFPDVSVTIYGSQSASHRIIEIQFTYSQDSEKLHVTQQELSALAQAALETAGVTLDDPASVQDLWAVYQLLSSYTIYTSGSTDSAYRFLSARVGNLQGATMALALLCSNMDLDFYYVTGTLDGQDTCWLLVQLEDTWCHLDLTLDDQPDTFLHSDQQMLDLGYSWDFDTYPAATIATAPLLEEDTPSDPDIPDDPLPQAEDDTTIQD